MKTKKILVMLLSTMMVGTLVSQHSRERKVEAADRWAIIGKGTNIGNWDRDNYLDYDDENDVYTKTFDLFNGDSFKFRRNESWGNNDNFGAKVSTMPANFVSVTGYDNGDIKCTKDGRYLITLHVAQKSFDATEVSVTNCTVTYYNGSEILDTHTGILSDSQYTPKFNKSVTGYRLMDWYTDISLSEESLFTKGDLVTGNLDLYGKFVEAEPEYIYVKKMNAWTLLNVHLWNEDYASYSTAWPGQPMALVNGTTNIYYYEIPAEDNYKKMIINTGSAQTGNNDITFGDSIVHVLASNNTVSAYRTYADKVVLAGQHIETEEADGFYYRGANDAGASVVSTSAVYYVRFEGGAVVATPTTTSDVRIDRIYDYIMGAANCATDDATHDLYEELYDTLSAEDMLDPKMVEVRERLDYIRFVIDNPDSSSLVKNQSKGINNLLGGNNSTALVLLLMTGIIGLVSIVGYYFYSKKKYSEN